MAQVFISYSTVDQNYADQLAADLRRAGIDVWKTPESIDKGEEWVPAIQRGLATSTHFVLIVSPAALKSRWVNFETQVAIGLAVEGRIVIIPLHYQLCPDAPIFWKAYQWVEARHDHKTALLELIRRLHSEQPDHPPTASAPASISVTVGGDVSGTLCVAGERITVTSEAHDRYDWGRPEAPAPPPVAGVRVEPKPAPPPDILDILPPPFEWIAIPAGQVRLEGGGYVPEGGQTYPVERFWIAKYPLTNAQFQVFVEAADGYREAGWWDYSEQARAWRRKHTQPREAPWGGPPDHPRVRVTWHEAVAFCRWLTARLSGPAEVRLPTEQEWQRAAQGDDGRKYPWGNQPPDESRANWGGRVGKTTPVGSYPAGASSYGVLDMAGNVWEWCLTDWETGSNDTTRAARRVLRGGSWGYGEGGLRAALRDGNYPASEVDGVGFRCARSS